MRATEYIIRCDGCGKKLSVNKVRQRSTNFLYLDFCDKCYKLSKDIDDKYNEMNEKLTREYKLELANRLPLLFKKFYPAEGGKDDEI